MIAAAPQIEKSLVEMYEEWLASSIDEEGVSIAHALQLSDDGSLTVYALALPPKDAYPLLLTRWASEQPRELIFGFDRFAKDGQGTTLGDLVAGFHFTRAAPRPFVIEYQHAPRIMKPIEWENAFWNGALTSELRAHLRNAAGVVQ